MKTYELYHALLKPSWAPPPWIFTPVWTTIYILMAISFGYVINLYMVGVFSFSILLPFVLNLFFNFSFTLLQFKIRNNVLSLIDVILVWVTLVWMMFIIYELVPWVVYMNIPYLIWVTYAVALQATITHLNRD